MTSNPRVIISQGEIEGLVAVTDAGKTYFSFRGIPFAEPPVGELRFKPPVPHAPWSGVRDATKDGNKCVQIDMFTKKLSGFEDCLFLNVYTPKLPSKNNTETPLPVMAFIHGGGFVNGSGRTEIFGPDFIVEQDVILVTMNYRLGPFGFLCLDIPEAPGNMGLRDQNLVLKWIQENIQFFNGDHNNVTLFGSSTGSAAAEFHLLSPMSQGLFHKAILLSGSVLNPWAVREDPLAFIEKVKKKLGIEVNSPMEVLKYFKEIDANRLITVCTESVDQTQFERAEITAFSPVIEKKFDGLQPFISEEPLKLLKSGNFTKVPVITGICDNEGEGFKIFYQECVGDLSKQDLFKYLPQSFKVDRQKYDKIIEEVYVPSDTSNEYINEFLSDLLFVGGIHISLMNKIKFTPEGHNYFYMFTYRSSFNLSSAHMKDETLKNKAWHADDYGYLTKMISNVVPSAEDNLIRERMVKMLTDFAKTGNPTPEESSIIKEKWLPITRNGKLNMLVIGQELQMREMPWKQRMSIWEDLYNNI